MNIEIKNETTVIVDGVEYIRKAEPEKEEARELTYKEVLEKVRPVYYIRSKDADADITTWSNGNHDAAQYPTERAAKQAAARIKLEVVAHFLNEGWERGHEPAFYWAWVGDPQRLKVGMFTPDYWGGVACFKTNSLAERARAILGDELIKQSLGIFD